MFKFSSSPNLVSYHREERMWGVRRSLTVRRYWGIWVHILWVRTHRIWIRSKSVNVPGWIHTEREFIQKKEYSAWVLIFPYRPTCWYDLGYINQFIICYPSIHTCTHSIYTITPTPKLTNFWHFYVSLLRYHLFCTNLLAIRLSSQCIDINFRLVAISWLRSRHSSVVGPVQII